MKGGHIIAQGWHRKTGEAHAEIHALQHAGKEARGADCYLTLEPCVHEGRTPPCTRALIAAGIRRVVAAAIDPNPRVSGQGIAALRQAGIETQTGLMEDVALALNPGFEMRMRHGRPYVRVKLAMSLDGRTALAGGQSRWITGSSARRDVHHLRAQSSAIITGIGTVCADDPRLTVRDVDTGGRQPLTSALEHRHAVDEGFAFVAAEARASARCGDHGDDGGATRGRLGRVRGQAKAEAWQIGRAHV